MNTPEYFILTYAVTETQDLCHTDGGLYDVIARKYGEYIDGTNPWYVFKKREWRGSRAHKMGKVTEISKAEAVAIRLIAEAK